MNNKIFIIFIAIGYSLALRSLDALPSLIIQKSVSVNELLSELAEMERESLFLDSSTCAHSLSENLLMIERTITGTNSDNSLLEKYTEEEMLNSIDSVLETEAERLKNSDFSGLTNAIGGMLDYCIKKELYTKNDGSGQTSVDFKNIPFIRNLFIKVKKRLILEESKTRINAVLAENTKRDTWSVFEDKFKDYAAVVKNPYELLINSIIKLIDLGEDEKYLNSNETAFLAKRIMLLTGLIKEFNKDTENSIRKREFKNEKLTGKEWIAFTVEIVKYLLFKQTNPDNLVKANITYLEWNRALITKIIALLPTDSVFDIIYSQITVYSTWVMQGQRYYEYLENRFNNENYVFDNNPKDLIALFDFLVIKNNKNINRYTREQIIKNINEILTFPTDIVDTINFTTEVFELVPDGIDDTSLSFSFLESKSYIHRLENRESLLSGSFGKNFDVFLDKINTIDNSQHTKALLAYKLFNIKKNMIDQLKGITFTIDYNQHQLSFIKKMLTSSDPIFNDYKYLLMKLYTYDDPGLKTKFSFDPEYYLEKVKGKTFDSTKLLEIWDLPFFQENPRHEDDNQAIDNSFEELFFVDPIVKNKNQIEEKLRLSILNRNRETHKRLIGIETDNQDKSLDDRINEITNLVVRQIKSNYKQKQKRSPTVYDSDPKICNGLKQSIKNISESQNLVYEIIGELNPEFATQLRSSKNINTVLRSYNHIDFEEELIIEYVIVHIINANSPCYEEDIVKRYKAKEYAFNNNSG